jgi:acetyl-CoA acyltransferase
MPTPPHNSTSHSPPSPRQACISACQAVTTVASMINSGQIDTAIAGGAETMSDVPIRFSKEMRKRFIASMKYKKPLDWLKFFKGFKLSYLAPEAPAIAEFSTGEVMGHSSDRLVSVCWPLVLTHTR